MKPTLYLYLGNLSDAPSSATRYVECMRPKEAAAHALGILRLLRDGHNVSIATNDANLINALPVEDDDFIFVVYACDFGRCGQWSRRLEAAFKSCLEEIVCDGVKDKPSISEALISSGIWH